MIKVGIVGYGYWGPNLVRNFSLIQNCTVAMVSELREERLNILRKNYSNIKTTKNYEEIISNNEIDAVVIATPVGTHFELAKKALDNGKHVLLEKPMTGSAKEAEELISISEKKGKVLMVDHTFLYTGAVKKIKYYVNEGTIGDIQYFDSTRINLGLFQHDVNVLWDLAPHDISILAYLVKEKPVSINAVGSSHTSTGFENIAYLTVNYQSGLIAHFNCSWVSPVKIRNVLIGGSKKMIQFNDLDPIEKIKVFDTGYKVATDDERQRLLVDYRTGDIFIPKIETTEALYGMANDFITSILESAVPISDKYLGLLTVQILESAERSIKNKGKEVEIGK